MSRKHLRSRHLLPPAALALALAGAAPAAAEDWSGRYLGFSLGAVLTDDIATRSGVDGALVERDVSLGLLPDAVGEDERAGLVSASIGHLRRRGGFVDGFELDLSLAGGSAETGFSRVDPGTGMPVFADVDTITGYRTELDALATLRYRAGLVHRDTLFFATAGLAAGRVENRFTLVLDDPADVVEFSGAWDETGLAAGWTAGVGLERPVTERSRLKLELLYYDLQDVTIEATDGAAFPGQAIRYEFENTGVIARLGISIAF